MIYGGPRFQVWEWWEELRYAIPNITSWYGGAGVNVSIPVFNGFLFNARAKSADFATQAQQKKLEDLQNNVARDVRNSWLDSQDAYQRLSVTQQLKQQADLALELAQARYKLGLGNDRGV